MTDWLDDYKKGKAYGITCSVCKQRDPRGVTIYRGNVGKEYCRLHHPHLVIDRIGSIFEGGLTLHHVKDEKTGKPITVSSMKELRKAEKDHHFALAALSTDGTHIQDVPTNEADAQDVRRGYDWKFARDPAMRDNFDGISSGRAANKEALTR